MSKQSELDEILDRFGSGVVEAYLIAPKSRATADLYLESCLNEAQTAILDWHNKQVEAVLDRLSDKCEEKEGTKNLPLSSAEHEFNIATQDIRNAIAAERAKLKVVK